MDMLQYTATVLGGSGQWVSFSTQPPCWGAVGSGSPSAYYYTNGEQWAVHRLQHGAIIVGSNWQ